MNEKKATGFRTQLAATLNHGADTVLITLYKLTHLIHIP